jgi:crossover junction endodeoxyribonuclease RuvC
MGITPQQFKQLEARLTRKTRVATTDLEQRSSEAKTKDAIILGIDPSLRGTGYGVIRIDKPHHMTLAQGTISCPSSWEHSRCLALIARTLREVIAQHHPTVCAIEGLFFAQNLRTALIMGEARGASLATVAESGIKIYELAPRKVKQAIVGFGGAQKMAVAKMVQRMLHLAAPPAPDAADALALALAHANESSRYSFAQPKPI